MDIVVSPITAGSIKASIPISVAVFDNLSKGSEIILEIQMEDYKSEETWFRKNESGSKFSLLIKGKPGFCLAALHHLTVSSSYRSNILDVFKLQLSEKIVWDYKIPWRDIFSKTEELKVSLTGKSYIKDSGFFTTTESGPKFSIKIKGSPGFTQLAAAQINSHAPFLRKMLETVLSTNEGKRDV